MGKLVANVDDDVKARAAALYDSMGMSLSTAVNMFLHQTVHEHRLPFHPGLTQFEQAVLEADSGPKRQFDNVDELMKELRSA